MADADVVLGRVSLLTVAATLSACGGGGAGSADAPAAAASTSASSSTSPGGSTSGATTSSSGASGGGSTSTGGGTPVITSAPMGETAAARLLMQGTFGATLDAITSTAAQSYDQWFSAQAAAAQSLNMPKLGSGNVDWSPSWFDNVVLGPDQLRQRMAFALSQILVVSGNGGPIWDHNTALAYYYDILVTNALGNYRTLLEQVTLSPTMGEFLSMMRSDKPNAATGVHADQNYAREVMQLFTIGLVKLNDDGSVQVDGNGVPVPTYDQPVVEANANAFTGWASAPSSHTGDAAWQYDLVETKQMVDYEDHHDTDSKSIIDGVTVPAGGTCAADLKVVLDTLFNHPNVGPFVGKQLIQRLVCSNPSPGYVQRIAAVFADNGQGQRGDLLAVAKAILTDPEATATGGATYGKLREPLIRLTNLWRAFDASDSTGHVHEYMILLVGNQEFGQYPLQSPTVFNFYRPDYQVAGALTQAGLVAPEFQITNEATLVLTANRLQNQTYQYTDSSGTRHAGTDGFSTASALTSTSVMLRTAQWEAMAGTPSTLVDNLNLVFMAGEMPSAMRDSLIAYASAIPSSQPAVRVIETAELLINSPQYAIQR